MIKHFIAGGLSLLSLAVQAQQTDKQIFEKIFDETMLHGEAYDNLHDLCKNIGHRLAGSPQADMAVRWSYELMQSYDLDSVWLHEVLADLGPRLRPEHAAKRVVCRSIRRSFERERNNGLCRIENGLTEAS